MPTRRASRSVMPSCHAKMELGFILLFLPIFPLPSLPPQSWLSDLDKGLETARKKNRPLILDIYAPWCAYCRRLQKKVYPSPRVREFSQKFARVRIDGEKQKKIMKAYGVRGFPTIILLDSKGFSLDRIHGFIEALPLRRRLKKVHEKSLHSKRVLEKLKEKPYSPHWNYEAGSHYFTRKSYAKAHEHFLRAWKLKKDSPPEGKEKQSLYNAAVCSMRMDRYRRAVLEWNLYLQHYPKKNKEYIYARYYRGLCYFYQDKKKAAQADLSYAEKYLGSPEEKRNAKILLQKL